MPIEQPGRIRGLSIEEGTIRARSFNFTIQSDNYVPGVSGWRISRGTGDVEFNEGAFRGDVAISGDLEVSGTDGILVVNGGDITVDSGGDIIITGGKLTAGPTTVDSSGVTIDGSPVVLDSGGLNIGAGLTIIDSTGVQVGTDVVIDSTGLEVIGGMVTPVWPHSDNQASVNDSWSTTPNEVLTVVIDPPDWVETLFLFCVARFQMSNSSGGNQNMVGRIINDDGGASEDIAANTFTVADGEVGVVTVANQDNIALSPTGRTVSVTLSVSLNTGTNSSNNSAVSLMALGVRN